MPTLPKTLNRASARRVVVGMAISDQPQQVSSDDLRLVADSFDVPASTVNIAFKRLSTDLAKIGPAWGDDETGTTFANIYLPAQEQTFKLLVDVGDGLNDMKSGFVTMADNYDAAENANSK